MTQEIVSKVIEIHDDRVSSNGTPYCAVVLEEYPDEWFFIWEGDFKDDVERFKSKFLNEEVQVFYRDKEDDPDDHFFNVDIIVPESPEVNKEILDIKIASAASADEEVLK